MTNEEEGNLDLFIQPTQNTPSKVLHHKPVVNLDVNVILWFDKYYCFTDSCCARNSCRHAEPSLSHQSYGE